MRMPRTWWVRDLLYLIAGVVVLYGVWVALEYLAVYWPPMRYYNRILALIGINVTLAVSLNIINGHAGQFSLGHAGFMGIGGYMAAFLTFYYFGPLVDKYPAGSAQALVAQNVLFLVAVLAGGLLAALAGYLVGLPSLRLRGDYLAIVTLGFGEIIRVIILNVEKIGAARGFSGIPPWANFFWVFFFCALTIVISKRLVNSSVGRGFLAVREDEVAASAMGVDTTRYKVKAFVIGSFLAGIAGGLYAHYTPAYLNPTMFTFLRSFDIVVMVVLGGLGSISGSIITAAVLTYLPEGLRAFSEYRMVLYSLTLIVLMRTRPQGLFGRKEIWEFMPRRKDTIAKEARDEGNADDKLDRDSAPPVT
jgi:branched-chain amino acid transport system permease protein